MTPFLEEKLTKVMMEIIEKFMKKDAISSGSISFLIDIYDTNNRFTNKKIEIWFDAKTFLIKDDLEVVIEAEFKPRCLSCYQSVCSKLKEHSPLKYEIVIALRSLFPWYINHHPN